MTYILHAVRAAIFSTLILTLWSVLSLSSLMESSSDATGFLYTATAFGLIGLPQLLYGIGLGLVIAIWAHALKSSFKPTIAAYLSHPDHDRKLAAWLVAVPVMIATASVSVGATHLMVTSKFVRANFQALGLVLVTAIFVSALVAVSPLLITVLHRIFARIPLRGEKWPILTSSVLGLYGAGTIVGLIGAYAYASSLHVWSSQLLQMSVAAVVLTPVLFGVMLRVPLTRIAWTTGIPAAGALAILVCFVGASSWALSSQEMRRATLRDSHLVAATAGVVIKVPDASDSIFAFDVDRECADDDEDCVIAALVVPLSSVNHPARRSVDRAIEAANLAQINRFEQIPSPPPNLVMILIDTLRQDHLGYAGYERNTSPNIDKIAEDAVVFLDSYAPSPHTPRSIPPLFFSRYSSRMRWDGPRINYPRVRPENLSLFEVLQDRGYHNIGMTSHFYFSERQGIRQGFQTWDNEGALSIAESNDDIAAPRIWEKLQPVIDDLGTQRREKGEAAQPFSLFIHLFEPHARWIGHKEFDFGRGETVRERHINNYDSEIAFTDSYIGKIVEKLREQELYDDTIFVITSDHGEAFNEHGYFFHGQTLYNPVINIPLIIRVPGWFSRRVEGPVSLIDVAPTLLDLWEIPIPQEFEGISLIDTMLGRQGVPLRPVFSELLPYTSWKEHHRAMIYGHEKYIENFTLGLQEYYDLSKDPGEQENLISQKSERVKELQEMLQEFMNPN